MRQVSFYLPVDLHRDLHIQARIEGITGSALLEELIRDGLRRREGWPAHVRRGPVPVEPSPSPSPSPAFPAD